MAEFFADTSSQNDLIGAWADAETTDRSARVLRACPHIETVISMSVVANCSEVSEKSRARLYLVGGRNADAACTVRCDYRQNERETAKASSSVTE
jgi:hypothetical protein